MAGFVYYALYRSGHPLRECVEIGSGHTDFPGEDVYYDLVDLRKEIFDATSHTLSGIRSVMSMVAGFYAAGHQTRIEYAWDGHPHRVTMYKPSVPSSSFFPVPAYFIYGFARARCEWTRLCSSLKQHIAPASRLKVLEATGLRYMRTPHGPVELCIP